MIQKLKENEIENMKRVERIRRHPLYIENYEKNVMSEKTRIFCHHDMSHFLDVARLAYIFSLERNYSLKKDIIYAAALLHDIGKWKQYADKTPHEIASSEIAELILTECQFDSKEREQILTAIRSHRQMGETKDPLSEVLYLADKLSRPCFSCPAEKECNWSESKKNLKILW